MSRRLPPLPALESRSTGSAPSPRPTAAVLRLALVVGLVAAALPGRARAQELTFSDVFESGSYGTNWPNATRSGAGANPTNDTTYLTGGTNSSTGLYAAYMDTGNNRFITTRSFDMRSGAISLAFDIRYVPSGGTVNTGNASVPFRDAMDDANDNIAILFSTDNATWTTIDTFTYNDSRMSTSATGGAWTSSSSSLTSYTLGLTTYFRWSQGTSGRQNNAQDNWAIDNVVIRYNTVVPEPGTWALFGAAAAGLAAWVVRRRRARTAAAAGAADSGG